ncbi:GNAT family N-acetyltransferase [Saliniramus sp.]|uniref:GNAT family N-acetyltransferase n=1 Tax=Saliniramus sp. TaxID=2986772 RepID=UPI002CB70B78|nr:GNAT family N-acetyltransferase [Saliniramus sp.]HMB11292.1 GNAT family N-acetyltransferase [Saliniramus sp.]
MVAPMWARSNQGVSEAMRSGPHGARGAVFDPDTHVGEDIAGFRLCLLPARAAESLCTAWRRVASRALVPDPFLHPLWLAAVARHDNTLRDLQILTVWRAGTLCGLFPLRATTGFLTRGWQIMRPHPAATGAPFLLREEAERTFAAACMMLGRRATTLQFDLPQAASAFAALVRDQSGAADAPLREGPLCPPVPWPRAIAAGPDMNNALTFQRSSDAASLRSGVEHLLDCDARAAARQGRRALLHDVGTVNAIRAASRAMAGDRSCQVALLREGEEVLAAALVLFAHGRAVIWHEATDPACPGAATLLCARLASALARRREKSELASIGNGLQGWRSCRLRLTPRYDFLGGFTRHHGASPDAAEAHQVIRRAGRASADPGHTATPSARPASTNAPPARRAS